MKSIGSYVVLREVVVGEGRGAAPASAESAAGEELSFEAQPRRRATFRTLWAADRLTGLPVLLHPLTAIAAAPRLPAHPRLLPFTDMVVEMAGAYLVTELPPQTRPARDPMQAARGALEALSFLHAQGLAHGSLDAAQLWDVDGQLRVTGAGLPRPGLRPQPLDDLRDLVAALETLDAPPTLLAALRGAPDLSSAREFMDLLDMGLSGQQLAGALPHVTALGPAPEPPPAIFDSPADIVLGGALADDLLGPAPELSPASGETGAETRAAENGAAAEGVPVTSAASGEAPVSSSSAPPAPVSSAPLPRLSRDLTAPAGLPLREAAPEQDTVPEVLVVAARTGRSEPALSTFAVPTPPVSDLPNSGVTDSDVTGPAMTGPAMTGPDLPAALFAGPGSSVSSGPAQEAAAPEVAQPHAPVAPEPGAAPGAPASARPRAVRRAAGREARERLKADHRRRLDLSELRLRRTAAEVEKLHAPPGLVSSPLSVEPQAAPADEQAASPQERRRLEQQAWEEQAALDAELAAARRALAPSERPASVLVPGAAVLGGELAEIAEVQRRPRTLPLPARAQGVVRAARQLAPIRMGWGRDGERQVLRRRGPREELLRWLLPTLGALLLAFAVAALPRAVRGGAAPCCEVQFRLLAAEAGKQATLTLLSSPAGSGWQAGTPLGRIPGTVRLPAPGSYRIKVSADGYAPARIDVTAPRREPVTVQLGR
ncbi:hypothetical protein [Deinococcus wulumuqiensis]|uniref:PEGA domain-containing protein n=3 Tax=Deinococcus wulumuqiensis TaxID=980427 RepID=A0AAV4K0I1_9DEIO|nr:hypothetical protein [Deinococcus wulumuqiensis]QII19648.1 hypothetical protein G6R31_01950 [Deinococcus wulumuqiensis R12]GGI70462.1 hypothetical protein GCM10010914_00740 [Deinococcus wulumuqiensis]GGP29595.1 hypothetical protein GCM10008021_12460 [Deinococcus wulumuqiensis]